MLQLNQAKIVVKSGILEVHGSWIEEDDQPLHTLGLSVEKSHRLMEVLGRKLGVSLSEVKANVRSERPSINHLSRYVMSLSAGKICAHPTHPHEVSCPYPDSCPQCGYPVRD